MTTFSPKDADAWYERNKHKLSPENMDPVMLALAVAELPKQFGRVFEFGCVNGWRLNRFMRDFGSECWGAEISAAACRDADPRIKMNLEPAINSCDLAIMGFCLYLVQPQNLFYWTFYADKILKDGGYLIVHDFLPDYPYARTYEHNPVLQSRKMNHAKLWLSHPGYSVIHRKVYNREDPDDCTHVTILKKDMANAFPLKGGPDVVLP